MAETGCAVRTFELCDGGVRPCEDQGDVRRVVVPRPVDLKFHSWYLTRKERRREARKGTRGRRGARRVGRLRPFDMSQVVADTTTETLHVFKRGRGEKVGLYLSDGIAPTEEHGRMLEAFRSVNIGWLKFGRCPDCGRWLDTETPDQFSDRIDCVCGISVSKFLLMDMRL